MKIFSLLVVFCLLFSFGIAGAEEASPFKNELEKRSYGMGMDFGAKLKKQPIELDTEKFVQGIKDALSGGKALMTEKEAQDIVVAYQKEFSAKQAEARKQAADRNKQEGEAFLAENKKKEGVITLPSGLQYKVLQDGSGKQPKDSDTVVTHYRGTLIDGTEFDSSYKRNQPATFPVNAVIPGWTEALKLMKEGSKWQLFVPSNLAYGERGAGAAIGPNATLIFEVELLSVKEQEAKEAPAAAPKAGKEKKAPAPKTAK
ncbi:MAG: macrophage infectivity potentiator Mip [Thermodesulfovibrionales bacterium]